jgi:3-hydroxybutyrate dehydrogenase
VTAPARPLRACATGLRLDVTSQASIEAAQIAAQALAHGITEQQVIEDVMLKPMPKHAFVAIGEVGALVEFLAGDAARNITGQSIAIDGSWTAQ